MKLEYSGFIYVGDPLTDDVNLKNDKGYTKLFHQIHKDAQCNLGVMFKHRVPVLIKSLGVDIVTIPGCSIKLYISVSPIVEERHCVGTLEGTTLMIEKDVKGYPATESSERWVTGYKILKCTAGDHDLREILKGYTGRYATLSITWSA